LPLVIFRRKGKRITVNLVSPKRAQLEVPNAFQNSAVSITYLLTSRSKILSSLQQQYNTKFTQLSNIIFSCRHVVRRSSFWEWAWIRAKKICPSYRFRRNIYI